VTIPLPPDRRGRRQDGAVRKVLLDLHDLDALVERVKKPLEGARWHVTPGGARWHGVAGHASIRLYTTVSPTPRQLGARIRTLRTAQAMSQAALAKRARLTRVYITRLEAGHQDPSPSTINALARALGVKVSRLIG
jgi:DNA-binding XRE family transcriptional regulator